MCYYDRADLGGLSARSFGEDIKSYIPFAALSLGLEELCYVASTAEDLCCT
jgi:hypothetical protein